jgi:hypothetical protein
MNIIYPSFSSSPSPIPACLWLAERGPIPIKVFSNSGKVKYVQVTFFDLEKTQDIWHPNPNFEGYGDKAL